MRRAYGVLGREASYPLSALPEVTGVLPWHRDIWSQQMRQLGDEKLAHAILLVGERYSGKQQYALALARILLCHSPVDGFNCGRCKACEMSRGGSHGDFRQLRPEPPSKVIKIDQIRDLVEFAGKTANLGQRKVVLIAPADAMTTQAANALLKSLEEPSPDTHMILLSHRPQGLPATIRSRCQVLKFTMPGIEQSLAWLAHHTQSEADSKKALELARGKVMLAASLCQSASLDEASLLDATMHQLFASRGALHQLDKLMSEQDVGELLVQLQVYLQHYLRDMDTVALRGASGKVVFALLDEVNQLQKAVFSGANPNRQMLLDSLNAHFDAQLGVA